MSEKSLPSTIEILPTELWCEIFKFFDAEELFYAFNGLNTKITSILSESTLMHLKVTDKINYEFSSDVILPSINNRVNIKSIKFFEEFQIEDFFTLWPINTFSQLRCLSLVYLGALMSDCSILMLEQLSTLAYFEYLHIKVGYIAYSDKCLKRLLELIFVENDVFHSLKRFVIQCNNNRGILYLPATIKQTILEFLTLPSLNYDEFIQLLPCIPHIESIKINCLIADFDTSTLITKLSLNSTLLNCVHLNLKLGMHFIFEDIQFILKQVPNVNQLKLTCNHTLINGNKWEMLLTNNCLKLQTFQLVFYDCYINTQSAVTDLQHSFSTIFWLERNVQFEYNERFHHFIVRFKI